MSRGKSPTPITTRTIRIDNEVYDWLASKAAPFRDGPNSVLRRMMAEDKLWQQQQKKEGTNGR